ncbi:MAG: nuclear transport factor 2 family protein [Cyanobacteria bacterium P01_F01_bin.150]
MSTLSETSTLLISALDEIEAESSLITQYFTFFNEGKFQQVSQLFSDDGQLYPPFEEAVVGPEAIATYLFKEADGMNAEPKKAELMASDSGNSKITVQGKVTALVFKVNVGWEFYITSDHRIQSVRVNLLAGLEELIKLRPA